VRSDRAIPPRSSSRRRAAHAGTTQPAGWDHVSECGLIRLIEQSLVTAAGLAASKALCPVKSRAATLKSAPEKT